MNEDCRLSCPVAEMCFVQHDAITEEQSGVERAQQSAGREYHELWDQLQTTDSHRRDNVRFAHLAAALIHEGVTGNLDASLTMNRLLEDLLQDDNKRAELIGRLALKSREHTEMEEQRKRGAAALERSQYAMALLEEAQSGCGGPRISITGKMLLARAAVLNWIGLTPKGSYEALKIHLFKKFSRCTQPQAIEAAAQYGPTETTAA